jgi:hypothetical protein
MNKQHKIEWEVLHYGQIRKYTDSIYRYKIVSDLPEKDVKRFCVTFLYPAKHEAPNGRYNGASQFPFGLDSYYKFVKTDENTYEYTVCRPYTG